MAKKGSKTKKSFLRRNRDLLIVFAIFIPFYYGNILTQPRSPFEPRRDSFAPYERHTHFTWRFPFVTSYFLMLPENYSPQKHAYPTLMMLHGASRHMYGGKVLGRPQMRNYFPFIVIIPIAPFGFAWAMPQKQLLRPEGLPIAMGILRSVQKITASIRTKSISPAIPWAALAFTAQSRVITAYLPLPCRQIPCGTPPARLRWIIFRCGYSNGKHDQQMPVETARSLATTLKQQGRDVHYTEFPKYGHGAWIPAYENPKLWTWLISQSKAPSQQAVQ
ncbi:MAG: hypothetical protein WBK55_04455 [Alphaproteobacteria bacterium]